MIALLLTVDFPPNKGGVSRYYEGLVASSYPKIGIAGVDLGEKPPEGKSLKIRLKQIFWAKNIIKQTPTEIKILIGQPHLAIGSIIAIRRFALFIHGGEWGDYPLGAKLVKLILYRVKVLITNSNATYKEFIPKSLQSKTIILKPGLSDFSSIKNEQDYNRNTDTIKKDFVNIISVARLSPRKGHLRLINATKMLLKDGLKVKLKIIGNGNEYEKLYKETQNQKDIEILTNVSDSELIDLYQDADLFALLPMRIKGGEAWEGFGIVFLEAGALGLPIITTNTGGIKESTNPLGTTYLDENCTEQEIFVEIKKLIGDKNKLIKMGLLNREWALTHTWKERQNIIDQILEEIDSNSE